MSDTADLLSVIERVRGRIRLQVSIEGAVTGATIGLLAAIGAWPFLPRTTYLAALGVAGLVGAGVGAAWKVAKKIPSARAAAIVDRAVSSERDDAVLIACDLMERGQSSPMAALAIARGAERARAGRPSAIAPLRRPPGVGLAVLGVLAGTLLAAIGPAPTTLHVEGPPPERARRLGRETVSEVRATVARARQVARSSGDRQLATLAERLAELVERAAEGALTAREAGELGALADEAARAAHAAESIARGEREAARALARAQLGGEAAARLDGRPPGASPDVRGASESARRELADRLAEAAEAARTASDASAKANGGAPERKLERLSRDLDDAARDCRRDPAACQQRMDDLGRRERGDEGTAGGGDAPGPRSAEERRAVGDAARRMADELAGRERTAEATGAGERRRFEQSASGTGAEGQASGSGSPPNAGGQTAGSAGAASGSGPPGSTAGEAPEGRRSRALGTGQEIALPRAGEAGGPSRATVIETAAGRGFSDARYHDVFGSYEAVVEDALAEKRVPDGRRATVRAYFDLIRPRGGSRR